MRTLKGLHDTCESPFAEVLCEGVANGVVHGVARHTFVDAPVLPRDFAQEIPIFEANHCTRCAAWPDTTEDGERAQSEPSGGVMFESRSSALNGEEERVIIK